jgi:signal transduction histidine kinase
MYWCHRSEPPVLRVPSRMTAAVPSAGRLQAEDDLEPGFARRRREPWPSSGCTAERGLRAGFLPRRPAGAQRAGLARGNAPLDSAPPDSLAELRRRADELRASRARIVAAADAERRRIERDLHDGAQQHLISLAVKLLLAAKLAGQDPGLSRLLQELSAELRDTAQELRSLVHGIYPAVLRDDGLEAALREAARRAALPATVQAASLGRYPADVEAAVYFCCLEALQNACKHAGQRATVRVRLRAEPGALTFEVADDGAGFDEGSRGLGAGLANMADRIGAFGGRLRVDSAPGRGTRIGGAVPVPAPVTGGAATHAILAAPVPGTAEVRLSARLGPSSPSSPL